MTETEPQHFFKLKPPRIDRPTPDHGPVYYEKFPPVVEKDEHRRCMHYIFYKTKMHPYEQPKIPKLEMYLSDEVKNLLKQLGWKKLRRMFLQELGNIEVDPFGNTSIDPSVGDPEAQRLRTINAMSILENITGFPVAVKGTGQGLPVGHEDREDLLGQYLLMRQLQIDSAICLRSEQRDILSFCPVYAAIRIPVQGGKGNQEWLLMARVAGGERVRDHGYNYEWGPAVGEYGMDPEADSELMRAFGLYDFNATWRNLAQKLRQQGLYLKDLAGRNVLRTIGPDGRKHYTIIDQKVE